MPTREERQNYKIFSKELDTAIKVQFKGTGWRKKKFSVFKEIDDSFFVVDFIASIGRKVQVRIKTKPMELDPLFWEIFKLPDNNKQPLSFRAWGVFVSPSVWIYENTICFENQDIDLVASKLMDLTINEVESYKKEWDSKPFTVRLLRSSLYKKRGPYAVSHILGMICEGKLDKAREIALRYESGELQGGGTKSHLGGETFERLAVNWIDERL